MEERRFLRREWLVINHSVSLDVTLSLRAAQETIPESKNRAYPSALHAQNSRLTNPCQKLPLRVHSLLPRLALRGRRVSHSRNRKHRPRGRRRRSKASRGRRPVWKRPSSLKYVPAGGNYAFNYLNE